jgi:hypothetical protein
MFGHQDDKNDHENHEDHEDVQQDTAVDTAVPQSDGQDQDAQDSAIGGDQPVDDDHAWQHPGEPPANDDDSTDSKDAGPTEDQDSQDDLPGPIRDVIAPAGSGNAQNPVPPMPINARDISDDDANVPHELIDIKQKALTELKPLIGQLDQTPEDKFRTLMMIIQASDNQGMIKQAYDVAEDIKDEKARAQALLDLVNEINYFTQHPGN